MYKSYKIIMAAMAMGYGGAETHVLELARYLAKNGADVKIISNGGAYEKELEAAGIEHISAPFHARKISDMIKAGKILKQLIKQFKPDIVHAHARIPAFVASRICKKLKVPLVTTTHGTYSTSFLLKFATNWGDYNLYVSDDIKEYLMKHYKMKSGVMTKTINAINTNLFARTSADDVNGDIHGLRREFNIKSSEKIILTVSRTDKISSFSAYRLIDIAPLLYQSDKNTRIIIVGSGSEFENIKRKADAVNQAIGFDYIIITGGRTDVYRFCVSCDVFVGISRAALEALACEKNVILCGDYGYLGRFCAKNKDAAENTNFTCRGVGYPSDINGTLFSEIIYCLDVNSENSTELVNSRILGAELIARKYSIKRMADDAYSVYEKAVLKYKDCDFILTGYYGHDNVGDDALLFTIISNITKKSAVADTKNYKICVLTKNPSKLQNRLSEYFANIVTKSRFNIFHVRKAIKTSKALVFGGGTLLQDNTSTRSLSYYLLLLKTAQKYGKKTILYANGIGPVYLEKNKHRVKNVMQNITFATIRDRQSYDILLDMGIDTGKMHLTADEAVTIKQSSYLDAYKKDFKEYIKGDYIVVSIRRWKSIGSAFFSEFAVAINIICRENNVIPVYVVMESRTDNALSQYLSTLSANGCVVNAKGDIEKILSIIRSASAVISMRLHTIIFAAAYGIPMVGISYDPKVRNFLNHIFANDNFTVDMNEFNKDVLVQKMRAAMTNKDEIKTVIETSAKELYDKAESNADLFIREFEK